MNYSASDLVFVSNQFLDYSCPCDTASDDTSEGTGSYGCVCEDD